MRFLLDTDMCIYWLRAHPAIRQRVAAVPPDDIAVSIIAAAELRYGADCSSQPTVNHQAIDGFLSGVTVLTVDDAIAREFGALKAALRQAGTLIEDLDILIAATARAHALTLVTNNLAHFRRIAGLQVVTWV